MYHIAGLSAFGELVPVLCGRKEQLRWKERYIDGPERGC